MRPGAVVVVDSTVFKGPPDCPDCLVVAVPATERAAAAGRVQGASMLALGAYAAATGVVSLPSLRAAAHQVLPPYRAGAAAGNADALEAGYASVEHRLVEVWDGHRLVAR
jgi:Pyruvate/2-oxoacid:ferredoxin oxidoreductase gamma subunit